MSAYSGFSTLETPQRDPIPGEAQVVNNAGGYVYEVTPWMRMERFLILGSEGGSYYASPRELTKQNALNVIKCIELDPTRAIAMIAGISFAGRAANNDPAIFALALAAGSKDVRTRAQALAMLPTVCRIPTHLFHFLTYVQNMRGWGRGLKRAVASWYNDKAVDSLAHAMVKYQSRDGWSHADVLRLAHPKTTDPIRNSLYKWAADDWATLLKEGSSKGYVQPPFIVGAFEEAKKATIRELCDLIRTHNLSREMLPTEALKDAGVWEALLERMPVHAMVRNLATMTDVGLLKPLSNGAAAIAARLRDRELLKRSRMHPASILIAQKVYASGRGVKGSKTWSPVTSVVDALNDAFYLSFDYLEPTGKRMLIAVDVSGSMETGHVAGIPLSAAEGAAAMALACAKTEPNYHIVGFTGSTKKGGYWTNKDTKLVDLGISPNMRIPDVLAITHACTFGPTDCALPALWALENGIGVDGIVIITDNETWHGEIHPKQALEKYRKKMNIPTKQVVMGMTATQFSIGDPLDPLSLDVAGFDAAAPGAVQEFLR